MPPNGDTYYARPEVGGLPHPPEIIPSHLQLGAQDPVLLTDTARLSLTVGTSPSRLGVTVTLTNTGAGHHLPTDYPGRHLLLLVTAAGPLGEDLILVAGPTVPFWGGDDAGEPGRGYAKLLQDVNSGDWPVVSYWNPTQILADTRLPAFAADTSSYTFLPPPAGGEVTLTVRLIFRHLFQPLASEKGWTPTDFTLAEETLVLDFPPGTRFFLPAIRGP